MQASITLYEHAGYKGRDLPLEKDAPNFVALGFNDKASSIKVHSGQWTVYEHVGYKGRSLTMQTGDYDIAYIREHIGNDVISSAKITQKTLISLYEHAGYKGKELILTDDSPNFIAIGFNDKASSIKVRSGQWTVYEHVDYKGSALTLQTGDYDIAYINKYIGNDVISSAKTAQKTSISLYEHAGYKGSELILTDDAPNFVWLGFNDKASSIKVHSGQWTVYEHVGYKGRALTLNPGDYDIAYIREKIGNDVISSARPSKITLYEHADYKGRELVLKVDTPSFISLGFNDVLSSCKVALGSWDLFEHVDYKGRSVRFGPGDHNIREIREKIGNDVVSSAKIVG